MEVVDLFLPEGFFEEGPFSYDRLWSPPYECKKIEFEREPGWEYLVMEVTRNSVTCPAYRMLNLAGQPVGDWSPFTEGLRLFMQTQAQRESIQLFTSIILVGREAARVQDQERWHNRDRQDRRHKRTKYHPRDNYRNSGEGINRLSAIETNLIKRKLHLK
jgi:hypothetical protein